jgi:hypothetical protein
VTAFVSRAAASPDPKPHGGATGGDLDAFGSEEPKRLGPSRGSAPQPPVDRRRLMIIGAVAGVGLMAGLAVLYGPRLLGNRASTAPGRVTIGTTPIGVEVFIDGQSRGRTPLSVEVPPGSHSLKLQRGSDERTLPLQVGAGADVTQHYEFAPEPAAAAATSTLSITTDPPGARVMIDGEARGTSPLIVPDLTVARHRVSVTGENGTVERQVTTEAGVTSSLVFSLPKAPAVSAGWIAVQSPFEVQVVERGDVVGSSASPKFMIPTGVHEVDLVNETLGFKEHRRIDVNQGSTATVKIDARAPINANARPWADVLIDGQPVGQTPIANLSLTLGTHQIIFRHPELGERQQVLVVTASGPNRVAVDLTKK